MTPDTVGTPLLWTAFTLLVLTLLAVDLGVFHRREHTVTTREALLWTVVWIALALAFNACIYAWFGAERGLEFFTGYLIEKALSVDNIFVFLVIFSYFQVPTAYQHRVLFWGILGALLMRAIFILLGAALLQHFHWIIYLFGAFLIVTGIKMLRRTSDVHPERNPVFRLFHRLVPSVNTYHGPRFTVIHAGKRVATPLFLVLLCVETTDIVFAVDSIPAIFAITRDPFIVYTSNIFAILGLRALYFVLAGVMGRFHLLHIGLALVLVFVGAKMLLTGVYKVPVAASLTIVASLLAGSVALSLLRPSAASAQAKSPHPHSNHPHPAHANPALPPPPLSEPRS